MVSEEMLQSIVDEGGLVGAVALIWRDGEVILSSSTGWQDRVGGQPIRRDTLFRIASMTKPITTVAGLMLHEEGRFDLDDPITTWAPEFEEMSVLRTGGPLSEVTPAARAITFADLLTHRSGITYADFEQGPLGAAYTERLGPQIDNELTPSDWILQLAGLPLVDQPGANFHYGHSTDLLGLLLERMDEAPLSDVLARRVFQPLGMTDTGFTVPSDKAWRCAANHGYDARGHPAVLETVPGGHALADRPPDLTFFSGGQGLWSTIDDYLAFARIFVEGGTVDGRQILKPETLTMMTSNQLTEHQRATGEMLGGHPFAAGHGYGFGVAVVVDPETADPTICGGDAGAVGWPGAYGGWWQADPNDRSVMMLLTHNMASLDQLADGIGLGAWDAITQFQTLGSTPRADD
jgi:CubicO group peptidase (beta-lactamase class C family)